MSLIKSSDLAGFTNRVLKQVGVHRHDNNVQYFCPFCHHRKRKLEVRVEEPYQWHCWTCNAAGIGLYSLLKKLNSPASDYDQLRQIVGDAPRAPIQSDMELFKRRLMGIHRPDRTAGVGIEFPGEFRSLLDENDSFEYKKAINYAKKRKLTVDDIIKHNIGYCSTGHLRDRLVFPSYDANNNLNFYSCRSYYDEVQCKYINSTVSKNIIGFENVIDFNYPISLCEGALDAISIKRNAIPLFGKTMSERLRTAIVTSSCPEINVVLDDDALTGAIEIAEDLISVGKRVRLVRLSGKDPNVLGFKKTQECINNTEFLDFSKLMMLKLGI